MSETDVNLNKGDADDAAATDEATSPTDPEQVWREEVDHRFDGLSEQIKAVLEEVGRTARSRQEFDDIGRLRRIAEANEAGANRRASRNGWIAVIFALLFVGATLTGAHFYDAERAANDNGSRTGIIIDRDGLWVHGGDGWEFKGYVDDPYSGTEPTPRELPTYCEDIKDFVLQFPLGDRAELTESCRP